jgi:uncharacterized membrane protein
MGRGRLEAFGGGMIAVVITITVLACPMPATAITSKGRQSSLSVIVNFYKGCINAISLMDSSKMEFYRRDNVLPDKP